MTVQAKAITASIGSQPLDEGLQLPASGTPLFPNMPSDSHQAVYPVVCGQRLRLCAHVHVVECLVLPANPFLNGVLGCLSNSLSRPLPAPLH